MLPIYSECKFGIDDSINSIVEVILERLKPKWIFYRLFLYYWYRITDGNKSKYYCKYQLSQSMKLFVCILGILVTICSRITKKCRE